MFIGELSKKTGLSLHTIRFYENLGLIHGVADEKVKTNNYKNYDEEVIDRLEIIIEAKEVGFTLAEIRKLLDSWYGNTDSKEEQIQMFHAKIQEIDEKILQLQKAKKKLEKVKKDLEKGKC